MISIIIPCYNTSRYINNIIEDVQNQSYSDWELILVSNGKEQFSQLNIMYKYALHDRRIKVIETQYSGVSNARNIGINHSNGEWICFVDADDRLEEKHLEYFVNAITKESEIIEGGFTQININGNKSINILKEQDINLNDIIGSEKYIQISNQIGNAPWHTLFKTEFIKENKIFFDPKFTMNEDRIFKMKAFLLAKRIQFIPKTGYIYIASIGSAMSKYHATIEESWETYLELKDKIKRKSNLSESQIKEERLKIQYYLVWQYIWNMFKKECPLSFFQKKMQIKKYMQAPDFIESCKIHDWSNDNIYYKLFYICINMKSPFMVAFLFTSQHYIKQVINLLTKRDNYLFSI